MNPVVKEKTTDQLAYREYFNSPARNASGQFVKGVRTRPNLETSCVDCGKKLGNPWANKTSRCSRCSRLGVLHSQWAGDKPNYFTLHSWTLRIFGKAQKCENKLCLKRSKTFDWALRRDHKYERGVKNFMQLCRSCHTRYDRGLINIAD